MPTQRVKSGTRPPWIGLSAAVWVEIAAGNAFNFPLYSHSLKSVLGYNQQQLTLLGVANDIGESVAFIPGNAITKFAPWKVLSVGAFACFIGYGLMWLSVTKTIPYIPYFWLWIVLFFATNSNAWLGTAVLVTNMKNFPLSRGTVSGILKGYAAIGGAIYTVIYNVFLDQSSTKLLFFLALGIPIILLAMMYFIRPCEPASGEDSSETCHFLFTQIVAFLAAFIILIITVADHAFSLSNTITYTLICLVILLLLSPLAIPIKMTYFRKNRVRNPNPNPNPPAVSVEGLNQEEARENDPTRPLLKTSSITAIEVDDASDLQTFLGGGEDAVLEAGRADAVRNIIRPRRAENLSLCEAIRKANFWLLWFLYFLGVGSGVTVLNNLAQVGMANGINNTTVLLCIFSFFNFVGRVSSGSISEYYVKSRAMPRTVWMTLAQIFMVVAFILFAISSTITLYIATGLLGVCYGFQYSLMVPIASELFGMENIGTIYSAIIIGNPIGAVLFSGVIAGHYYDVEATKQGSSACHGPECFRFTFIILACLCGVAAIIGAILTVRIIPVYKHLYGSRSPEQIPQVEAVPQAEAVPEVEEVPQSEAVPQEEEDQNTEAAPQEEEDQNTEV